MPLYRIIESDNDDNNPMVPLQKNRKIITEWQTDKQTEGQRLACSANAWDENVQRKRMPSLHFHCFHQKVSFLLDLWAFGQALGAIELWRKTFVKLYFSNVFCVKIVSSKETCLSNWTGNHFHFGIWIWQCNAVVAEDNFNCHAPSAIGILIFPIDIKTVKCPIFGSTTQRDQAPLPPPRRR